MAERFVCASASVCETFDDIESAKAFAKAESEKSGERVIVYLQYGTMCGVVAQFLGGADNGRDEN